MVAYGPYLGGAAADAVGGLGTDQQGNAYVAGFTFSADFRPLAESGLRISGPSDVFVFQFSPEGRPLFARLLGGSGSELDVIAAADATGAVHVAGTTFSHDFPSATELARDPAYGIQFFARIRGGARPE